MLNLHDLLDKLPPGRRRVVMALVERGDARTYSDVAKLLDIHLGTVHRHLRRVRLLHPEVYSALMTERARQLAQRHVEAIERAEAHSRAWHRKRANRRYFYRFGCWPWERWR